MKRTIFLLAISIFFVAGCRDNFLDTSPYSSLGEKKFWQNEGHALSGVAGVYQNLTFENVYGHYLRRDALTPTVLGFDRLEELTMGTASARDGIFQNTWRELYRGVQRANDVLHRLPGVPEIDEDVRARFVAETKCLRALYYFNLMDYFGGVPIYDAPVIIAEANKPRNTEDEVRAFIISDLNDAIQGLPETVPAAEIGRATKGAAIALRGKVYLYNQQWAEAEADFKTVMDMGLYDLHPNYAELFTEAHENSSEFIFSVQFIHLDDFGNDLQWILGSASHAPGNNWNNYVATNELVDSYENIDGSPFHWDDIIPGFSAMTREEKDVIFLRDDITDAERDQFLSTPELEALYIEGGNEARIKKAWENRDPRLNATVILPYTTTVGQDGVHTFRWPYRNGNAPLLDLQAGGATTGSAFYPWRKFVTPGPDLVNRRWGPINYPVIRYADVLLMFAEARNENSGLDNQVFDAINEVRTRAGIPALQNVSPAEPTYVGSTGDMRERIRKERSVEFVLEGTYYGDVRRWDIGEQINNYEIQLFNGAPIRPRRWFDHYRLWPIPAGEIENNPELTQNPGWES